MFIWLVTGDLWFRWNMSRAAPRRTPSGWPSGCCRTAQPKMVSAKVDGEYIRLYKYHSVSVIFCVDYRQHRPFISDSLWILISMAISIAMNCKISAGWVVEVRWLAVLSHQEPKMTAYMGCIGDDAFGRRLQQACEEDGVTTRPGMWELQTAGLQFARSC